MSAALPFALPTLPAWDACTFPALHLTQSVPPCLSTGPGARPSWEWLQVKPSILYLADLLSCVIPTKATSFLLPNSALEMLLHPQAAPSSF